MRVILAYYTENKDGIPIENARQFDSEEDLFKFIGRVNSSSQKQVKILCLYEVDLRRAIITSVKASLNENGLMYLVQIVNTLPL